MNKIVIENPTGASFSAQLSALYQTLTKIDQNNDNLFDLSNAKAPFYPLILLPLGVYINDSKSECVLPSEGNSLITEVMFPKGTDHNENFSQKVLPIVHLTNHSDIKSRDQLICDFIEALKLNTKELDSNSLFYPITELLNNVFEHSKKDEGWVFAIVDKKNKFIDVCIVDSGRGLRRSYIEEENLNISHLEAIGQAMTGHSTKKDKDRGYGLFTTKNIICKGLLGNFLVITGNAVLIAEGGDEKVIELDRNIWNGVVLAYRIPLVKKKINIYDYLE